MSLQPNSQYTDLWSASKLPNCLKCSFPLWIILPQVLIPALICKTDNVLVFLWGILTVLLTEHLLMSEGLLISNRDVTYFWISILFTSFSNAMCLIIILFWSGISVFDLFIGPECGVDSFLAGWWNGLFSHSVRRLGFSYRWCHFLFSFLSSGTFFFLTELKKYLYFWYLWWKS